MHERTKELKRIMADYELKSVDVAGLLDRKKNTIETWLSHETKRPIPPHMLQLLKLLVQTR